MINNELIKEIESFGFFVVSHYFERPWGGFLLSRALWNLQFKILNMEICNHA